MTSILPSPARATRSALGPCRESDLLLREMAHRSVNDLQLVVSLLAIQSRRTANIEARQALADAMHRVAILADARSCLLRGGLPSLETALRAVADALSSQAEPRGIVLTLELACRASGLSSIQIATLALVVNELATNAIKHAFDENRGGQVTIFVRRLDELTVCVGVDDDGRPFPETDVCRRNRMGLGLARRLVDSVGGLLILPPSGSKSIEVRVPAHEY
ncbi:sensor histidine kinase [Novosphingobium sp. 9U]|uniref:sensor histidine kinase n=1 Tax=Novosphingobium sp. 9U TaxID=2653158 RepID=UPI001356F14C|nr:sensor histidine kinase [Novosphingobium sp. 9U]